MIALLLLCIIIIVEEVEEENFLPGVSDLFSFSHPSWLTDLVFCFFFDLSGAEEKKRQETEKEKEKKNSRLIDGQGKSVTRKRHGNSCGGSGSGQVKSTLR